jgi:hypothetical protein
MTAFNPRIGKISCCAFALAALAAPLTPAHADETGELTQTIADFTQALTLAPNNVDALLGRGDAFGRTGDFVRSFADINRAAAALDADISRQLAVYGLD